MPPVRTTFEIRLRLNLAAGAKRARVSEGLSRRVEKALSRRATAMGLKVHECLMRPDKITVNATIQPGGNRRNIERGLHSALRGILQREAPHLVKRGGLRERSLPGEGFVF